MDKKSIVDFFDSRADKWDDIQIIRAEKIDKILDVAGIDGQSRVLDVACGTGVLEDFYLKRGARYVLGADISPKMVELAKAIDLPVSGDIEKDKYLLSDALLALIKDLGIKTLSEQGVTEADFDRLSDDVLKEPVLNFNPRQGVTKDDVLAILKQAF